MSTPPLSRNNSQNSFEKSSEEKSNEKDFAPSSQRKSEARTKDEEKGIEQPRVPSLQQVPETQQKKRREAGTWKSVGVRSAEQKEKGSDPFLSPRRANPPTADSRQAAPVPSTTAKPPMGGSSQTPASVPSASAMPASVSTSAAPGKVASNSEAYDKTKVPGDKIPSDIANALRAGFQGYVSVPDPTNPSKIKSVPVFNIPPKKIARLFVGLESNFGQEKLTGQKMVKPLRDKFGIKNFRISDATVIDEINFIDHILKPFIQKEFNKEEFEQARREVRDGFNRFASKGNEVLLHSEEGKNIKERTIENFAFMTNFELVISPLVKLMCGPERKLGSSSLSKSFKDFLLEIDRSYSEWTATQAREVAANPFAADMPGADWMKAYALANVEKPKSANPSEQEMSTYRDELVKKVQEAPEALLKLKKAALNGVTFNRALNENWTLKFSAESRDPDEAGKPWVKHLRILNGGLGHYTSFKFDDFFIDVMTSQPDQPEGFQKLLLPLKKLADMKRNEESSNAAKQGNKRKVIERSPTVSGAEKGEKEKKGSITSFFQGMISPRKAAEQNDAAPVSTADRSGNGRLLGGTTKSAKVLKSSEGKLLKQAEARKTQMERRARKEVKDYLKEIKLPAFDLGYTAHLNEVITQRVNYEEFQLAPAAFCMEQLLKYRDSLEAGGKQAPATLDQIEKALIQLVVDEKQVAEKELRAQSTKAAPQLPSLDLSELKRSPFLEDDDRLAKANTSEETEKSDSKEVESEQSSEPEREKS